MARFYANENFPFPVVLKLRQLGHDVLTVQETGKAGQAIPDEAVLEFAGREGRALLTLNRKHFIRLHKAKPNHAGIVACAFDVGFSGMSQRIHEATQSRSNLAGQLIRVNRLPAQNGLH